MKLKSKLKNTVLAGLAGLSLTACGGGEGGVSVSFNPTQTVSNTIEMNTDIFGMGTSTGSFISAITKMSADQVIDATEAVEAFEFVGQYNGTFDPAVLADYEITIDGQKMSLEKGWYALVGYKKKYYDGKETFWNNVVKNKEFDDEDLTYQAIEADIKEDLKKGDRLVDDLANTGKATIVSTNTVQGKTPVKTVEGDIKYGAPVVTESVWAETAVSGNTKTETRTLTTTTARSKEITFTYLDVTTTTFSNGDTKTHKEYRTGTSTQTLSDLIETDTENRTVTVAPTYTDTSVTGEVVSTTYSDPFEADATYTDWSSWTTTSTTTTDSATDVDNGNGTTTRTTRTTTYTSQEKTRTKSVQSYRTKTVRTTDYTSRDWSDDRPTEKLDQTFSDTTSQVSHGDPVTSTETETRTTNDAPGQIVATETFNNPSQEYTDLDPNLGTKTAGYNTDKSTYETNEYREDNNGFGGGSYNHINASSAYSRGWTGKGSVVAVADTGYDTDHTEFEGQVIGTKDYYGNGMQDNQGHGSHVLGTILAKKDNSGMHGVAFDAKAVVIKIGDSRSVDLGDAASGFSWAADQGAIVGNLSANSNYDRSFRNSIVSLSDGTYKSISERYDYGNGSYYNDLTPDAWKASTDKGLIIVNSAGNQSLDVSAMPGWFATETDSSDNLVLGGKVLIVGSYNVNTLNIDGFSNKAGHLCRVVVNNACTDTYKTSDFYVLAPGSTYSTNQNGGYGNLSGTSMAAPIVTGQVAILHQMWPHMKGENLVKLVTTTADKSFSGYNVNIHGQGIVDFDEATRPQGAIGIPTTGRVDGATSSVSNTYASGSISVGSAISNLEIMVIDDFDRDYYTNLGHAFAVKDNRKYSDVDMLVSNNNTFLPTQQMYGSFTQGGQHLLANNYNIGIYTGENGGGDYSANIGKDFMLHKNLKLKTSIGQMSEQETWLGNSSAGVLAVGDNNNTNFGNIGVEYALGDNVLSLDYTKGKTDINTTDGSLIKNFSDIQTESYRLAYEIHKDKHTTFGWSFSLPSHITSGSMDLEVAESVNLDGTLNYKEINSDLTQGIKEKNIGFYFNHLPEDTFDAGFNFTTEYRQDIAGQGGKDGVNFTVNFAKKLKTACKFLWMKNPKCFTKDANGKDVMRADLFGKTVDNATMHGLVYDLETDKFVPIKK